MAKSAVLTLDQVEGQSLRFIARVDDRVTFALDSGPAVSEPNPMQSLLAAVGACTGMDVISILRKQRQHVTGYEVRLESERRAEHPRAFTRIEVVHRVRGRDLRAAAIEEAIRLSDTRYCSVHASLQGSVAITSRYEIVPE